MLLLEQRLRALLHAVLPPSLKRPLRAGLAQWRELVRARKFREQFKIEAWESPPCIVCGGRDLAPHLRYNGFNIVRCRADGLIFVAPRPADLAPFYDQTYYTGGHPNVYLDYEAHALQSADSWSARLTWIEEQRGGRGALFDVGCATGAFLDTARGRGWRVAGIELSSWAVARAIARRVDVRQGSLPDPRIDSTTFDVVTMWDCIEHLQRPDEVLVDIRRILKPDGLLMFSTGAVPHEDRERASSWYFPPWHLYYFARPTIEQLLRRCGFEMIRYTEEAPGGEPYKMMVVAARPIRTESGHALV